jgi:hypothetical protein
MVGMNGIGGVAATSVRVGDTAAGHIIAASRLPSGGLSLDAVASGLAQLAKTDPKAAAVAAESISKQLTPVQRGQLAGEVAEAMRNEQRGAQAAPPSIRQYFSNEALYGSSAPSFRNADPLGLDTIRNPHDYSRGGQDFSTPVSRTYLKAPPSAGEQAQARQKAQMFAQLDQLRASPLGAVAFSVANLSGASPARQQAALDLGSSLDGLLLAGTALKGGSVQPFTPRQTKLAVQADLRLKYMSKWIPKQRDAANVKVGALNISSTNAAPSVREGYSAHSRYTKEHGPVLKGHDVDHLIDLQLGGKNDLSNLWPLDSSVNRSIGAQIQRQIEGLPPGTKINSVTIGD